MNIIELAREAGLKVGTNISGVTLVGSPSTPGIAHITIEEMERFAALVRNATLEEAAKLAGESAQKWWSIHCASNKHMETTRKAHDDFCALQAAIRAMKEQT